MTDRSDTVRYEVERSTAWITVHRPEKLNALDRGTMEGIAVAVDRAAGEDLVRVVVLTGSGDKAFVAGADIAEMSALGAAEAQSYSRFLQRALDRIERCPKPVVAAINGFALGGGCELALAAHVRIASERARFGQPEVKLGLIPGAGGTQRLVRIVGLGRALDLVLSGRTIDADEAARIGLVSRVVPAADLRPAVQEYAAALCGMSPIALERALEAVLVAGAAMGPGQQLESGLFGLCFATEDMREGTRAFLEKRAPDFRGR